MSVGDLVDLAGETFARAEWVALFLGVVGVYWLALGFGGMRLGRTRGFGWRAQELVGTDAPGAGRLWLLAGLALLIAAILIWIAKA